MEMLDMILNEEEKRKGHGGNENADEVNQVLLMMERLEEEISDNMPVASSLCCSSSSSDVLANCCVQSDSAFSMSSSSSRLSSPMQCDLKCRCHEQERVGGYVCDELGYLLGASDEELGIPVDGKNAMECDGGDCGNGVLGDGYSQGCNGGLAASVSFVDAGDLELWEMGEDDFCDSFCGDYGSYAHFMNETNEELTLSENQKKTL